MSKKPATPKSAETPKHDEDSRFCSLCVTKSVSLLPEQMSKYNRLLKKSSVAK